MRSLRDELTFFFPWRFPFAVSIIYGHPATNEIIDQESGKTSGKDY